MSDKIHPRQEARERDKQIDQVFKWRDSDKNSTQIEAIAEARSVIPEPFGVKALNKLIDKEIRNAR